MSLTRKLLESMGLDSDKVSTIIEAHAETVDALKAKIEEYKLNAEKLPALQKDFDNLTKELEKLKANGGDWEQKYSKEHEAFEEFKRAQTEKEETNAKEKAYRTLLKEVGVSESVYDEIVGVTDFKNIKLGEDGFEDKENIVEGIKTKWKGFITKTSVEGAKTSTPIKNDGGAKLTKEDIYKKDDKGRYVMSTAERMKAISENADAFTQS